MPHRHKCARCEKRAVALDTLKDGTVIYLCADHLPTDTVPLPPEVTKPPGPNESK